MQLYRDKYLCIIINIPPHTVSEISQIIGQIFTVDNGCLSDAFEAIGVNP